MVNHHSVAQSKHHANVIFDMLEQLFDDITKSYGHLPDDVDNELFDYVISRTWRTGDCVHIDVWDDYSFEFNDWDGVWYKPPGTIRVIEDQHVKVGMGIEYDCVFIQIK